MSDYMKEAERLIEDYGNAEWKVGRMSEHSDDAEEIVTRENARAALLAHIRRGVPAPAEVPMPDVFMYGVKEPDGGAWMGEVCVSTLKGDVDELVDELNNDCDDADTRYTTVSLVTTEDAKRYGDAREAAGYARGLAEAGRDAERYRWLRRHFAIVGTDNGAVFHALNLPTPTHIAPDAAIELDASIDATLRGEVKP